MCLQNGLSTANLTGSLDLPGRKKVFDVNQYGEASKNSVILVKFWSTNQNGSCLSSFYKQHKSVQLFIDMILVRPDQLLYTLELRV
jgi:hypothetical protein